MCLFPLSQLKNCNASLPLSANNVSLHFSLLICLSHTHTHWLGDFLKSAHIIHKSKHNWKCSLLFWFFRLISICPVLTHVMWTTLIHIIPNKQRQDCLHNVLSKCNCFSSEMTFSGHVGHWIIIISSKIVFSSGSILVGTAHFLPFNHFSA